MNKAPVICPIEAEHAEYLRDESRYTGRAEAICFPRTETEIAACLAWARDRGHAVTVQGARTGITGGAVPDGGLVMNLGRMNRFLGLRRDPESGTMFLRLQPGVVLAEINRALATGDFDSADWPAPAVAALEDLRRDGPFFFPPDPTETTAAIGGMAACNASGARSFRYGPTRAYVSALRVVLADGSVLALRRGAAAAAGRGFSLRCETGRTIEGELPSHPTPSVKTAAGYAVAENMDMIDLFIGSEGTLGVFSEIEVRLAPMPASIWGVTAFFAAEDRAVEFVRRLRLPVPAGQSGGRPAAIEFFDRHALDLMRRQKAENPAFAGLPELAADFHTGIYVEYHGAGEAETNAAGLAMSEIMLACGGDPDRTWIATDRRDLERLRDFRHSVPEAVNLIIDRRRRADPRITKLGTDLAVPDERLEDVLAMYHESLDPPGLDYVMFGHIGDNHVHVNVLPRNAAEYDAARAMYRGWAERVIGMGGTVSAEHGIGKLKTGMLAAMYGPDAVGRMKELKRVFDPDLRLNRGNLFG